MARRFLSWILLATGFGFTACADVGPGDQTFNPVAPAETDRLEKFTLGPSSTVIEEGHQSSLVADVQAFRGAANIYPRPAFGSNAPNVASVDQGGIVTGHLPGSATISASVTVGGETHTRRVAIIVQKGFVFDSLVISAKPNGWQPARARISAGSEVEWTGGTIAGSGRPVEYVWFMSADYKVIDSLDIRGGSGRRRFTTPGTTVRFCSNACWEATEWGIIYVD